MGGCSLEIRIVLKLVKSLWLGNFYFSYIKDRNKIVILVSGVVGRGCYF